MTKIFADSSSCCPRAQTPSRSSSGEDGQIELEDEEHLGCGIEIKASRREDPQDHLPAVRRRGAVAIALYFSILKVHPTPFCVMDEIRRLWMTTSYARYMRTLAGRISSSSSPTARGTMEEADVLYGVTMQEQGVSKILTINLNDNQVSMVTPLRAPAETHEAFRSGKTAESEFNQWRRWGCDNATVQERAEQDPTIHL
ncbi:MAG: hypothetical protein ACLTYN_11275 [Dysosmobacter welbionis]